MFTSMPVVTSDMTNEACLHSEGYDRGRRLVFREGCQSSCARARRTGSSRGLLRWPYFTATYAQLGT